MGTGKKTHLLCVLRDHEHEREVVHAECGIEESVCVHEEDNVLHGVFDELRITLCGTL